MYIYEDCLGDLYVSEDYEVDLECPMCGDSDRCLGYSESVSGAKAILEENHWDVDGAYVNHFLRTLKKNFK